MTLTIDLTPAEQARLTASARRTGLEPTALAKRLVTDHLPMDSDAASTNAAPPNRNASLRFMRPEAAWRMWE